MHIFPMVMATLVVTPMMYIIFGNIEFALSIGIGVGIIIMWLVEWIVKGFDI